MAVTNYLWTFYVNTVYPASYFYIKLSNDLSLFTIFNFIVKKPSKWCKYRFRAFENQNFTEKQSVDLRENVEAFRVFGAQNRLYQPDHFEIGRYGPELHWILIIAAKD